MLYSHLEQWRIQGGAPGAGSPSRMETGAPVPKVQGRQFSSPFAEYFSPEYVFVSEKLYVRIPAGEGALLIRKGALFAHDDALLNRHGAPPASRGALLARKGAFSSMTTPSKNGPLDQNGAPRTCSPSPMKVLDPPLTWNGCPV